MSYQVRSPTGYSPTRRSQFDEVQRRKVIGSYPDVTSHALAQRTQAQHSRPLHGRTVLTPTPAQNLLAALEQGKSIEECFPLFRALDTKTRDVAYRALCAQFGSKTGDVRKDGIDLFLEDPTRLLIPTSDGPRIIDSVLAADPTLQMPPLTPVQNLLIALEQGKPLDACFPLFRAIDAKTRDVVYQILCHYFGSKTGIVKNDGIELFLADPTCLLAQTPDGPRIIDYILKAEQDSLAPLETHHPLMRTHSSSVHQEERSANFEDYVVATSQRLHEIIARKEKETRINCGGMWTFLTTDCEYEKKYRDLKIQDVFGPLTFNVNSPEDAQFLQRLENTRFYGPAMRAIQKTPFKSLFAGSARKIVNNYFEAMLCHDWGSSQKAVTRLVKEVVKHCIVRDNSPRQSRQEHRRSPLRQHVYHEPVRQTRASRDLTNEDRIQIFRETLREIPKRLNLDLHQQMIARTQLIQPKPITEEPQERVRTEIRVENCTTFAMTRQLVGEGYRPLVLDMANAYTHGGGVTKGSPVQEETLCRQSNLYTALDHMNQQGCYPIPEHAGIFVPQVQFFRDDQYRFVEPFAADVFVSAAYDCNVKHGRGYDRPKTDEAYIHGTGEKIRAMLRTAILNGNDALVLGAFGCGAFDNDSRFIARLYLSILNEDEFRGRFRVVSFGVFDPPQATKRNYPVFQRILQPSSRSLERRSTHPMADVDAPSTSRPLPRHTDTRQRGSLYRFENVDRPSFSRQVRRPAHVDDDEDSAIGLPPPSSARQGRRHEKQKRDDIQDTAEPSFFSRWSSRIGGMFSSAPRKTPNELLVEFYQGKGPNSDGLMFEDILKWSDRQLENTGPFSHRYIQWLFPSWGESDYNKDSPVLSDAPHIAKQFSQDPVCMKNMERAFHRILKFYGLELDEESMTISRIRGHRFHWIKPGDHNYRRITRILGCLSNMGLKAHAQAFLDILEDLAKKEGRTAISQKSLSAWRSAAH
jgi:uncharacterized protein (TIGR02452 family)